MATLIENKRRILTTFGAIGRAIVDKGEIVSGVTSYADAISRIGPPSFVGQNLIVQTSGNASSSVLPYTLTLPTYTLEEDMQILVYSGIYGQNPGSSSNPDALTIYVNNESISCQQPVLLRDFHNTSSSTWTSWFCTRVCYNKLILKQGDTISVNLVINYVYSNNSVVGFIKLYDANASE